jgi:hypothetical protein
MAILSDKKAPACSVCGYDGADHVYKVKDGKQDILYHACPWCWFRVEYGKKSKEIMEKLGLKLDKFNRKLESITNGNSKEENSIEETSQVESGDSDRRKQGIEADRNNGSNSGGSDTGGATEEPRSFLF